MNTKKLKQLMLCVLSLLAAKFPVAGCYPLVAGVGGAAILTEGNRTLLVIFSLFGMALFLPIQAMAKYGMIIVVTAIAVKLIEWAVQSCRTWLGAGLCAGTTLIMNIAGELMEIRNRANIWLGILESIFVFAFILVVTPMFHLFLEKWGTRKPTGGRKIRSPENGEQLLNYAESFNGLSRVFSSMNHKKERFEVEEVGRMQQEITGKICVSCNQCALCWEQDNSPMYDVFYRLMHSIEKLGLPENQIQEEFAGYCPHFQIVIEEAVEVFEKARLNLAWYNRLLENREVIAQQLDAMAYIMKDCVKEYTDISQEEGRMLAAVKYKLRERGASPREIHLYEKPNQRLSLQVRLVSKGGNCLNVKDLAKAVSEGMRRPMASAKDGKTLVGKEEALLRFEEETLFHTLHGVARIQKDGAQISGDNFSFLDLEGGQSVLTLSDGMGSGIRACKESEMVIELIEKFLEAGFQKETAIRMMNSAMVMHDEDGMYSTVDMASIDLYTGQCEFYKIGAAMGFIKHGETIETISSTSLPAGIFQQLEIEKENRQLRHEDYVILVSDGVLDYLSVPEPEETMKEILGKVHIQNPGKLAKHILEQVLLYTGGKAPDDMTVLVTGVWER